MRQPAPSWAWAPLRGAGVALLVAGTVVLVQAFVRFVVEGVGTPAPIAPTRRLVVAGPYRYVRNPMCLAVMLARRGRAKARPVVLSGVWVALLAAAFAVAGGPAWERCSRRPSSCKSPRRSGRVTEPLAVLAGAVG